MKKQRLLKTIVLALMAMVGMNAWADSKTIYPSKERCDRTDNVSPTAWNSGFPKLSTSSGNTECEVKNLDARIWVLEQFVIPEIDRVKSITITYTRVSGQTNNGPLAIWAYPYAYPADDVDFSGNPKTCTYTEYVKAVLGVYPGNDITNAALVTTTGSDTRTATFDATAIASLKTAGTTTDGKLTVNILLTTSSGTTNYKFYSINSSNDDSKKPTMVVEYYPVTVTIGGTTTNYAEINSALNSSLTDDATINIYDDVNMSNRIQVAANKTVDVIPQKDGITITNTANNSLSFLAGTASGRLNIGNDTYTMTVTYSNTSTNAVVESSNASSIVDINNVIFSGISTSNEYGVIKANNGKVYLKNVTFSNCASTYATNPSIIKCGNNDGVVFEGNNQFTDCTGYDIFAASRFKINATNGVTNTTPIKVYTSLSLGSVIATTITEGEVAKFIIKNAGYGLYKKSGNTRNDLMSCEGYPLEVTSAGAATLMLPYDSTIPTGVTCYTLSYTSGDNITATEVTGGTLSANTPVLVIANEGLYYMLNSTKATTATEFTASDTHSEGVLTGVYQETVVPADNYILTKHGDAVGFRKADGSTNKVKAYRAYMTASHAAGAREFFSIDFDGDVTAINAVEKNAVVDNGEVYNLQGVRMTGGNLPKGIYVKNGKKFVIK